MNLHERVFENHPDAAVAELVTDDMKISVDDAILLVIGAVADVVGVGIFEVKSVLFVL
jgi:hypothetical protein